MRWTFFISAMIFALGVQGQIMIDQAVSVNGLWCFPRYNQPDTYEYLPHGTRLALTDDNKPQFSMLRYVKNVASGENNKSITQGEGGAIVSFLMEYYTDPKLVAEAPELLEEILGRTVTIAGPVSFIDGSYAIVSSILLNGSETNHLLASGKAPLNEGGKIALSFELTPERSKLLLESFKTDVPDISVVFDLKYAGLLDGYQATINVHWDKVRSSESWDASVNAIVVSADMKKSVDRICQSNAVEIEVTGGDEAMEKILLATQNRIMDFLYSPIPVEAMVVEKEKGSNMLSQLTNSLSGANPLKNIGGSASYRKKTIRQTGSSKISLNKKTSTTRYHMITDNIGDVYREYQSDQDMFKTVNLDDVDFSQREIRVGVDGDIEAAFDDMVNSVVLTLKKSHENGDQTIDELVLRPENQQDIAAARLIYGRKGDLDTDLWMEYKVVSNWSLAGGAQITDTMTQSSAMVNLSIPYYHQEILMLGDPQTLEESDVKVIVAELSYDFFGTIKKVKKNFRISSLEASNFKLTQPSGVSGYHIKLTWFFSDGTNQSQEFDDDSGVVFLDVIPDKI
jgi:hypothetical protein